jgi:hypothetical protein
MTSVSTKLVTCFTPSSSRLEISLCAGSLLWAGVRLEDTMSTVDIAPLDRAAATRVTLAFLFAYMHVVCDDISRTTGRFDYENFGELWPDDEGLEKLWHQVSVEQVRGVLTDAELMGRLVRHPTFFATARRCTDRILSFAGGRHVHRC